MVTLYFLQLWVGPHGFSKVDLPDCPRYLAEGKVFVTAKAAAGGHASPMTGHASPMTGHASPMAHQAGYPGPMGGPLPPRFRISVARESRNSRTELWVKVVGHQHLQVSCDFGWKMSRVGPISSSTVFTGRPCGPHYVAASRDRPLGQREANEAFPCVGHATGYQLHGARLELWWHAGVLPIGGGFSAALQSLQEGGLFLIAFQVSPGPS